jgi:hypothetical protein
MLAAARGKAILAGMALVLISTSPSHADPRAYCEAFARDIVDRKLLAAGYDASPATVAGETMANVETASLAPGDNDTKWRRTYKRSLDGCMDQYAVEGPAKRAITATPKPAAPAKRPAAVISRPAADTPLPGAPEPGTQAWNDYCVAKHPSYDAKTGLYRTYSGSQRKCR